MIMAKIVSQSRFSRKNKRAKSADMKGTVPKVAITIAMGKASKAKFIE